MLSVQLQHRFDTGSTKESYIPFGDPRDKCVRTKEIIGNNGGWESIRMACHKYRECEYCMGRRIGKYTERLEWYTTYVAPIVMIRVSADTARYLVRKIPSDLVLRMPQDDGSVVMFIDAGWRSEVLAYDPMTIRDLMQIVALDMQTIVCAPKGKRPSGDLGKHDVEKPGKVVHGEVWSINHHEATDDEWDDAVVEAIYATPEAPRTEEEVLDARNNRIKAIHDALNRRGIRNGLYCQEQNVKIDAINGEEWLSSIYLHERGIDGRGCLVYRTRAALGRRQKHLH